MNEIGADLVRDENKRLAWQSKAILLIVVPWTVISVATQGYFWATHEPQVAWTTLGISTIFGLIVWKMRAGTPAAAATGAAITASLMFSTTRFPYEWSWLHGGLMPLLAVFLLTYAATKIGRSKKEQLGTGESKRGRNAAQVAANLGVVALIVGISGKQGSAIWQAHYWGPYLMLAALAEAAADTVSSEIGQVFGGTPYMLTTMRRTPAGTDGAISFRGTLAGGLAATIIAFVGMFPDFASLSYRRFPKTIWTLVVLIIVAGTMGMIFDSLLGAALERRGNLNNDAVNFLSTLFATAFMGMSLLVASRFFSQ